MHGYERILRHIVCTVFLFAQILKSALKEVFYVQRFVALCHATQAKVRHYFHFLYVGKHTGVGADTGGATNH